MTEVLIIALSYFQYLFLKIVSWSFIGLAVIFMGLFPMLKLMVSATVEGSIALAALEKCLFTTNLATWGSISWGYFLCHL